MSTRHLVLFMLMAGFTPARAQECVPPPGPAYEQSRWSQEELDSLLAPVALYPDPLLAHLLPAASEPDQIVYAARLLREGRGVGWVDAQPWDDAVKSIARYPDVLFYMESQIDWTREVGDAFSCQPQDVMASIQQLRSRAFAAGYLVTTQQHEVVFDQGIIEILPVDPQLVYVPIYQPEVVYAARPAGYGGVGITFGNGCALGGWVRNELDWHRRTVWVHPEGWSRHDIHAEVGLQLREWRPRPTRVVYDRPELRQRVIVGNRTFQARGEVRGFEPRREVVVEHRHEEPIVERRREEVIVERPRVFVTPDRGTSTREWSERGHQSREVVVQVREPEHHEEHRETVIIRQGGAFHPGSGDFTRESGDRGGRSRGGR